MEQEEDPEEKKQVTKQASSLARYDLLLHLVPCRTLLDQALQLTLLEHLDNDIATTNQFTVNPQLGKRRPVGILGQLGADIRMLQDIDIGKGLAAGHQRLSRLRGKAATRKLGRTFHVQKNGILGDLLLDLVNGVHDGLVTGRFRYSNG